MLYYMGRYLHQNTFFLFQQLSCGQWWSETLLSTHTLYVCSRGRRCISWCATISHYLHFLKKEKKRTLKWLPPFWASSRTRQKTCKPPTSASTLNSRAFSAIFGTYTSLRPPGHWTVASLWITTLHIFLHTQDDSFIFGSKKMCNQIKILFILCNCNCFYFISEMKLIQIWGRDFV